MIIITSELTGKCAEFIKQEEGCKLTAYLCPGGKKTIGYGHVINEKIAPFELSKGISQVVAEELLIADLGVYLKAIQDLVTVPINDNQVIALASFAYNVGIEAFARSTLLKKLNAGANHREVAKEFQRWIFAKKVTMTGLINRRKREAELFLLPIQDTKENQKQKEKSKGIMQWLSFLVNRMGKV